MRETITLILMTFVLAAPALADGKTGTKSGQVVWEEADADITIIITSSGKVIWEEAELDIVKQ